ncbi:MAG: hypothetical protein JWO42_162 [Chloroflexi bacterium]|nr:hypothetical protein [Chloroflexota bacterium]
MNMPLTFPESQPDKDRPVLIAFLRTWRLRFTPLLLLTVWLGAAAAVQACSIDGIPSLSLDGRLVTFNYGQATKDNLAYWAAFSLGTTTVNKQVHLQEDIAKIRKALSAKALKTPFHWTFGDGASASGPAVQHRYRQAGWYKVDVEYYYPPQRKWIIFDSAQLHVLSAQGAAHGTSSTGIAPQLAGGSVAAIGGLLLVVNGVRRRVARAQSPDLRSGRRSRPVTRKRSSEHRKKAR